MRKIGMGLLVLVGISLSGVGAMAVPMVVQEQNFDFSDFTDWNTTFSIQQYDPANFSGLPLAEVMLMLDGEAVSTVDFTATTQQPARIIGGSAGAIIEATSSAFSGSLNVLPAADIASLQNQILVAGMTTESTGELTGVDSLAFTLTGSPAVDPFVGGSTVDVLLFAEGLLSINAAGGNVTTTQSTTAGAVLTVQYKNEAPPPPPPPNGVIPEPLSATLGMMGLGALTVCMRRRTA